MIIKASVININEVSENECKLLLEGMYSGV